MWGVSLAALMALGAGCSSIRLGYNTASQLSWWWLDGYVDFSREQAAPVRQGIDSFYGWHRATQLPGYVGLLAQVQDVVMTQTTAADICRLQDRFAPALLPSVDRALQVVAERLPPLTEAQFAHIRERYDKGNADARDDYLQPDPKRRQQASIKRSVERAERLYGSLDAAQLEVIREGVAGSPFDAERWLQSRMQRQDLTLASLRRLQSPGLGAEQRFAMLRSLATTLASSANPANDTQLREHNCNLYARLHNATTSAQRVRARDTLKGWEDDLRALSAASP